MPDTRNTLFVGTDLHPPATCMEAKMVQAIKSAGEKRGYRFRALSVQLANPRTDDADFVYAQGPAWGPVWLRKPFYGVSLLRQLNRELRRRPDLVHFLWVGFPWLTPYILARLRRAGIPSVVTVLNRYTPPDRYRLAAHLVVHSSSTATLYRDAGFTEAQITRQPPPVDRDAFVPTNDIPEPFFVMASGPRTIRQIEERGIYLLFQAFRILQDRQSPARLHLFGRWPEGADLLQGILENSGAGNVTLHQDHESDLPRWIARSAGVLIPYVNSTIGDVPMSALEALACGRPVIATRGLGLDDYLADSAAGLLIDPRPEALADAVETVLATPEKWAAPALAAVAGLDNNTYGNRLCDLYDRQLD